MPRRRSPHLSLLAGLGLAVLPKCPACWLAYMGLVGAAGLGRLPYRPWVLFVMAALLALATFGFWLTGRRWSRPPALLALAGAALVIAGRLWIDHPVVTWAGVAFLAGASVWDVVLVRSHRCAGDGACRASTSRRDPQQQGLV